MNILQSVERYSFYSFNITAYMSKDMSHYQRNSIRIIWYCRDWASFLGWFRDGAWVAITERWLWCGFWASFVGF